jgi:hypothetical protein
MRSVDILSFQFVQKSTYLERSIGVLLSVAESLLDGVLRIRENEIEALVQIRDRTTDRRRDLAYLVRSRESSEDELSGVRSTRVNGNVGASGDDFDAFFEVGEVQLGADTLSVHVESEGDEVDVSGTFTVSEEATLYSVGTGHKSKFGSGDTGSSVVVGVEGNDDVFSLLDVSAEVFDLREKTEHQ